MPTKSNTPPTSQTCQFCSKKITKGATVKAGHGARCAAMQKKFTVQQWQAHYKKISVATTPKGYVKVATFKPLVKSNVHKIAGLTVSKVVKAIGTDKGANPPVHPIAQPYYLPNRHRVVHPWLATQAGLTAIATGNFSNAPTPQPVKTI